MKKISLPFKMNRASFIIAAMLALAVAALSASVALAHDRRTVGKYELVVGFLTEPAYVNQVNGIDFRVTNKDTSKPVEGVEKTVNAEILVGGKTLSVPLKTRFGQPGAYASYFMPTKAGAYIFHFTGDIEGTKLDEKFESGPGRFNDVEDTAPLQFPEKLADNAAQIEAAQGAAAQVKAAQSAAGSAQTIAYVGIAVGVLGVILGAFGLMKKK